MTEVTALPVGRDGGRAALQRHIPGTPRTRLAVSFAALAVAAGAVLLYVGRGTAPFFDEWDWITQRDELSAAALLAPHNGHLSAGAVAVHQSIVAVFGLEPYWPYRVVLLGLHLATCGLVALLAARRVGHAAAVLAAALLILPGAAAQDVLWAFQIGFVLSCAAGVGALVALEAPGPRAAIIAVLLLVLSVSSSSLGLIFLIVATVEVVLRRDRARWPVVVVPIALYGLWSLRYGQSQLQAENVLEIVSYGTQMATAAVGGGLGVGATLAAPLLAVGVVALLAGIARSSVAPSPRLLALLAGPLALWALTALARAQLGDPGAARYVYPGALLLVLIAIEACVGRRPAMPAVGVLAAVALVAGLGNLGPLRDAGRGLRSSADTLVAQLSALRVVAGAVPPGFQPAPTVAPQLRASTAEDAQRKHGTLAVPIANLQGLSAEQRRAADDVLVRASRLSFAAGAPSGTTEAGAARILRLVGLRERPGGRCARISPIGGAVGTIEIELPPGARAEVDATSQVSARARRLADTVDGFAPVPLPAGSSTITAQRDGLAVPWRISLEVSSPARLCGA